jgi:sulfate-transporting ATPase
VEVFPEAGREPVPPMTLEVSDVTVRFGGVVAVDRAGFSVHPGEVLGLIGPNGAGKTTIIDAVTGFVRPASGTISLNEDRIEGLSASRRAKRGLRRSFQSLELFEDITVSENIHAGSDEATHLSWVVDLFKPGRHPLPTTAVTAVREFELEEDLGKLPSELPYGRRRLVGIARAVASGPSVLMLDEPAAGLDEFESRELARLIRRLADERRMAVLLVEHDVGLVMSTCDRIVVLDFGKVIATGTPAEIRDNPLVLAAYLGASEASEAAELEAAELQAAGDVPVRAQP